MFKISFVRIIHEKLRICPSKICHTICSTSISARWHDMLATVCEFCSKLNLHLRINITRDQNVTYASYLGMHHYLKHASDISDLQGSCCNLHYVCPSCLYSCYKVAKIFNWGSMLIVVRWNNDLGFIEYLSTYRVIELIRNLWRCDKNRKCYTKFQSSDII